MKSSPYENNPYTSSSEAPPSRSPRLLPLPAGRGEAVLALLLALLAAFTANSLLYGGLALGSALGIFGIFTVTALYLLIKSKHFGWYPLSCLAFSLILVAFLCPQQRRLCKNSACCFWLSPPIFWASVKSSGLPLSRRPSAFSEWGGRALFLAPYPQISPLCAVSL